MYHPNGVISDELEYENGIAHGMEKRFYEDGTLAQEGKVQYDKEVGLWKMYYPNGQLKQQATFVDGQLEGEVIAYYPTGKIKSKATFKNGFPQRDKAKEQLIEQYNKAEELNRQGDFKAAIKKMNTVIKLDRNWADAYFARGTMYLNNLQFDAAIKDFDKTVAIDPDYTYAYANRGFAAIRKHQLKNSKTLTITEGTEVLIGKDPEIPSTELNKICADLEQALSLGDDSPMVINAIHEYCKE